MRRVVRASTVNRCLWLLVVAVVMSIGGGATAADVSPPARWVDESACQGCHGAQYQAWQGSHHQLAMQPATESTVLGDFDDASVHGDSERSEFFRRGDDFWIRTPGPDGQPADIQVAYTLGVDPLQQYLLALPDGRLQAHGAAWDVAAKAWYHLYDGMGVDHRHPLHWTRARQNADTLCIECHTSGFRRTYDAQAERFDSHWQALGVVCQSCHGPASDHLRWADGLAVADEDTKGLTRPTTSAGVQPCARCHSRRTPLGGGDSQSDELLDDYLPVILTADLYDVDGTIRGEVFEYGSFRQSRMHAAGVGCSDCHEPHSARLRRAGNDVCTQCHNPTGAVRRSGIDASGLQAKAYDQPSHHHHIGGSPGSRCVDCHMPGKVYMDKDLRHDHSFSSPFPSQARELGHTDACGGCHRDDGTDVLARFQQWYPDAAPRDGGYARALHAAREGLPGAASGLLRQLARTDLADIRRATLLSELPNYPSAAAQRVVAQALGDSSALVRHTAAEVTGPLLPAPRQTALLTPLTNDPVRAVRLAASWQLLQLPPPPGVDRQALLRLIAEYEQVQNAMLDRAESHFNLAGVYQLTGRSDKVEPALRGALRQDATFFPALIMLAQWQERVAGDAAGALRLLRETIEQYPADASLQHALGLSLVRQGRYEAAREALRRAHELAPEQPEYGYVLAVALYDGGLRAEALALLRNLVRQHPANRLLRQALIGYLSVSGHEGEAQALLGELAAQNPDDPLLRLRGQTNGYRVETGGGGQCNPGC